MTSIGVGKPHWRLTEERSMIRVVEKLEVLGRSTLKKRKKGAGGCDLCFLVV